MHVRLSKVDEVWRVQWLAITNPQLRWLNGASLQPDRHCSIVFAVELVCL